MCLCVYQRLGHIPDLVDISIVVGQLPMVELLVTAVLTAVANVPIVRAHFMPLRLACGLQSRMVTECCQSCSAGFMPADQSC